MSESNLTVLMTVYNGGDYLRMALESVLGQTYKDFEFLIINDCSSDDSLKVIESFDDQRIVVHNNETNIGQTASLNLGLNLAKGKYIARIDADDVAFPHWLENQMSFIKENPGFAVVSANTIVIDENNRVTRDFIAPCEMDDIIFRSLTVSPINHGVSIIDKEVVLACGGYDTQHKVIADYGLFSRLIKNGHKLITNDEYLMAIRMHSEQSSISSGNDAYISELASVMRDNINYVIKNELPFEIVEVLARAHYSTETLDDEGFKDAIENLEKIYAELKPLFAKDEKRAAKWLCRQRQSLFLKRIYLYIEKNDFLKVRKLASLGLSKQGINAYFLIFLVSSWFGMVFLKHIPCKYELVCRNKIRIKLMGKHNRGVFL